MLSFVSRVLRDLVSVLMDQRPAEASMTYSSTCDCFIYCVYY